MSLKIHARKTVDLGNGIVSECELLELPAFGSTPAKREWCATVDTSKNLAQGWGNTPEDATRNAIATETAKLQDALTELQMLAGYRGMKDEEEDEE
jgi:hypothetical protein